MEFNTAGVIFVNNHFLKGDLDVDRVLTVVAGELNTLGISVKKVSIVEEEDSSVSRELHSFSNLFDVVVAVVNSKISTVSKSLANLVSEPLVFNNELAEITALDEFSSLGTSEICWWPKSIKLLKCGNLLPVLHFHRIFIVYLELAHKQIQLMLREHLLRYRQEYCFVKLFKVPLNGFKYLESIENLDIGTEKHEDIEMLRLSSKSFDNIVRAEVELRNNFSNEPVTSVTLIGAQDLVWNSSEAHIKSALQAIEKCFEMYQPQHVFLSFNGGKDCTVLHHLVQVVLKKKYSNLNAKLLCLYVRSNCAFKEQDDFIGQYSIHYNLEVVTIMSDIRQALADILAARPQLKACFMGTRRTDPFSDNLHTFEMTDHDWPQVMRCNPLLNWHYSDIWDYLLYYKVPYCKLYDHGYTSLGNATNTIPNPYLSVFEGDTKSYLPAYKMLNERHERDGRNKKSKI
ncbi:uncharacterized protein LOC132697815 [Cylas formicarius]|uniref:uncharacterized protein LOC132697815 n=1 Tax=Cylas formicarius TaxID=197179 RepID=UPI002958B571|nr:uncharacterized protein LOC132697815 [Cylas formicarius]